MSASPTLLIAGHGYLGTELGRQARAGGWETTAVTRSGDTDSLACDLSDPEAVAQLGDSLPTPSHIVHCASSGRGGPEAYRAVFLEGSRSLLAAFPTDPEIRQSPWRVLRRHRHEALPTDRHCRHRVRT